MILVDRWKMGKAVAILSAAFALGLIDYTSASALSMQECSAKYKAAQQANTLNGMKWNDFKATFCGHDAAPSTQAPIAAEATPSASRSSSISGTPLIVDGDTVEITGTKIRLFGVDTPETEQFCFDAAGSKYGCGISAREALRQRFGGRVWQCEASKIDQYGRTIGSCTANGEDVQAWLVQHGWGLAFVRYSTRYVPEQKQAEAAKVGMWAGCFIAPWEWRHRSEKTVVQGSICPISAQKYLLDPDPTAPDPNCKIKGNLKAKGGCIYHMPAGRHYNKLNMDSPGKRWFCTKEEAEAAGCRQSM